jgi:hypothetical protein
VPVLTCFAALTVDHIRGVWPTYSAHNFCHISSFMLALLFTSLDEEEFHTTLAIVRTWRQTLSVHAATCGPLVSSALAKIDRFAEKGVDSLVQMVRALSRGFCELTLDLQWQRKSQLAFYHPSTFSRVQPPLQTYTDVQLPPDPNLFSPPPEVAPSLASFYAPSLDDPTPYSDPAYVYSMPSSLPAQMHPSPPQLPRPYNGQTMPMPAPHAYGQHPIMPPTQSFFWSDNGEQFWTTEDHVHAGLVMGQVQMPKDV